MLIFPSFRIEIELVSLRLPGFYAFLQAMIDTSIQLKRERYLKVMASEVIVSDLWITLKNKNLRLCTCVLWVFDKKKTWNPVLVSFFDKFFTPNYRISVRKWFQQKLKMNLLSPNYSATLPSLPPRPDQISLSILPPTLSAFEALSSFCSPHRMKPRWTPS